MRKGSSAWVCAARLKIICVRKTILESVHIFLFRQSSGMKKGVMTSSNVNRVSVSSNSNNKSATKEKTQKVFGNGQGYTSYKQK